MKQIKTKLDEDGGIAIPAEYLQALGLQVGDDVILQLEGEELRIFSIRQAIKRAQQLVSRYIPQDRLLADELIAERRSGGE
jgi:bifunctional DNA-binding transcriptional regulator/antitoxin component of YhaV-PrlF toxin-antitoxin module